MAKITMYVIFEGCLASGKTTTAKLLGKKYSTSSVLLENASIHPFLSDFYGNRKLYSVETELNFVLIHYHQLKKAEQGKIFAYDVFGDFLIDKDIIFANVTLTRQWNTSCFWTCSLTVRPEFEHRILLYIFEHRLT